MRIRVDPCDTCITRAMYAPLFAAGIINIQLFDLIADDVNDENSSNVYVACFLNFKYIMRNEYVTEVMLMVFNLR